MPHERLLTVQELAELWNLSADKIRELFLDEPGVLIICKRKPRKRIYRTLLIPQSVVERLYRKLGGQP